MTYDQLVESDVPNVATETPAQLFAKASLRECLCQSPPRGWYQGLCTIKDGLSRKA